MFSLDPLLPQALMNPTGAGTTIDWSCPSLLARYHASPQYGNDAPSKMKMLSHCFRNTNLLMLRLAVDLYLNSLFQLPSTFLHLVNFTLLLKYDELSSFLPPLKLFVRFVSTHISKASPEPALFSEVSLAFLLSVGEHGPALDPPRQKDAISKLCTLCT